MLMGRRLVSCTVNVRAWPFAMAPSSASVTSYLARHPALSQLSKGTVFASSPPNWSDMPAGK